MKTRLLFLILFYCTGIQAQSITQKISTTQKFNVVCDSLSKLMNPDHLIIIKNCDEYDAFYLSKDSLNQKGYYVKNLENITRLPDLVNENPILTELTVFDSDNVYNNLVKRKIYSIKQFSENELVEIYSKPKQKHREHHTDYGLPHASDDCEMTIILKGKKNVSAAYRYSLIVSEEIHTIEVIKTFYDIKMYLSQLFK